MPKVGMPKDGRKSATGVLGCALPAARCPAQAPRSPRTTSHTEPTAKERRRTGWHLGRQRPTFRLTFVTYSSFGTLKDECSSRLPGPGTHGDGVRAEAASKGPLRVIVRRP